ncbi:hypothetical protein LAC81_14985 [Ensifer adhaerens]|uniref:hypothetical protein n=1 Tax=Ensifer adhaerens TaxID=106592 RepID=UPI001CBE17DD|nr:hypothetical protein [Ensifer adhaerens]MBZ7923095.1 hypothetical protein [Ensifer adhaerens]UAX91684.1 hypothetical protein LAC78_14980 [Ensifer adhaerens]UAX99312.1 hypothetical protein LAC80_14985 [Ensifer adhaerens]UAY06695.1 hypothetical protein LAC81_14985 [Ensifer adhaerens]
MYVKALTPEEEGMELINETPEALRYRGADGRTATVFKSHDMGPSEYDYDPNKAETARTASPSDQPIVYENHDMGPSAGDYDAN